MRSSFYTLVKKRNPLIAFSVISKANSRKAQQTLVQESLFVNYKFAIEGIASIVSFPDLDRLVKVYCGANLINGNFLFSSNESTMNIYNPT